MIINCELMYIVSYVSTIWRLDKIVKVSQFRLLHMHLLPTKFDAHQSYLLYGVHDCWLELLFFKFHVNNNIIVLVIILMAHGLHNACIILCLL